MDDPTIIDDAKAAGFPIRSRLDGTHSCVWYDGNMNQHMQRFAELRERRATAELRARIAELEAQLAESRANDRTAMGYLSDIRKIVGGDDFPDMVRRIAELEARQVPEGCEWKPYGNEDMPGTYEGACGIVWSFPEGSIAENECRFCPRCGGQIVEADSGEVKP